MKLLAIIVLCITGLQNTAIAQSTYSVMETEQKDIRLFGTSTLHDWEMNAQNTTGEAEFQFKSGSSTELASISSLSFELNVADLKSDNKQLDKNAYEALRSEVYKDIGYTLVSSSITSEQGGYLIQSKGDLTIAGVTKAIFMDVHFVLQTDDTVKVQGTYQLNMKDYDVAPPSFMWGAMKTGDALTLDFEVFYQATKGS